MNLIQTRVTDFETGERNIRVTLDIHAFVLNGVDKQVEEHAPESIVVEMPLRCAETFHLGQTICFTDPSLVREVEEITVRASAYNRDVMVPGKRTVTKTFPPAEVSREPGQPRPWEKRQDTELALLRTRLEAATSRADSLAVEAQQLEELRKREAAAYEKRLDERDQEVHDLVDQRNIVQRQMGDLNEALVKRVKDLEQASVASVVNTAQDRSPLQATPAIEGDTAQKCMDDLSDALNELKAVREALNAPAVDLTLDVAERRMTSILDLRAKIDNQDREIAQALSGLFHGDNAVVAVQKLAAHYRATSMSLMKNEPTLLYNGNKDEAQSALRAHVKSCAVGRYTHRKGGNYIVFAHTLDEATLQPLVHYWSLDKGTGWTRTVTDFVEQVDGAPRFPFVGDNTTVTELDTIMEAMGWR